MSVQGCPLVRRSTGNDCVLWTPPATNTTAGADPAGAFARRLLRILHAVQRRVCPWAVRPKPLPPVMAHMTRACPPAVGSRPDDVGKVGEVGEFGEIMKASMCRPGVM